MRFQGCRWLKAAPFISRSADEDQYGTLHGSAGFGRSTTLAFRHGSPHRKGGRNGCVFRHTQPHQRPYPAACLNRAFLSEQKAGHRRREPQNQGRRRPKRRARGAVAKTPRRIDGSATSGRKEAVMALLAVPRHRWRPWSCPAHHGCRPAESA